MSAELINCNSSNYNSTAVWNGQNGNVTTVGSNGKSSFFGTYDQNGNVTEITDSLNGSYQAIRGGAYDSPSTDLNKSNRGSHYLDIKRANIGFRIAKNTSNTDSYSNFITVSGTGNAADTTTYGSVNYTYKIGKYPVTNNEYVSFLNAIAADGASDKNLYDANMGLDVKGGIARSGSFPNYAYSAKTNMGDKPVNFVNWFNAARFINWISNGMLSLPTTTETGVYTINSTTKVSPNNKNSYWLPSENEWYKSAYYNSSTTSYYSYATQSNSLPDSITTDANGNANDTYSSPGLCLSPTPTATYTATITPTPSVSPTATPTNTASASATPSRTPTKTPTTTVTASVTPTNTTTATRTHTPTHTTTPTPTRTPTTTPTITLTPSITKTSTPTQTTSPTPTKSLCPSSKIGQLIFQDNLFLNDNIDVIYNGFILSGKILGQAFDVYESLDVTQTPTPTITPTITPTKSITPTITPTKTTTPTNTSTSTSTPTATPTSSITPTPTKSPTPTVTTTKSPTPTATATKTPTPSITSTKTPTPTNSVTPTITPSITPSKTPTQTPTVTPSNSATPTITPSNSATPTVTPSKSATPTVTPTNTITPSITPTSDWTIILDGGGAGGE